jgi:hypothetical protein
MLPNLGRLTLRHRKVPTSVDTLEADDFVDAPPPKQQRVDPPAPPPSPPAPPGSSSTDVPGPAAPASALPIIPPWLQWTGPVPTAPGTVPMKDSFTHNDVNHKVQELDDIEPKKDDAYKRYLKRRDDVEPKRVLSRLNSLYPCDKLCELPESDYEFLFREALEWDEPPNRHMFASYGNGAPIHYLRIQPDSKLKWLDPIYRKFLSVPAYNALKRLRKRFGNKPIAWNQSKACGSSNCFEKNVRPYDTSMWATALRSILFALTSSKNWMLPKTVGIRAPKASTADDEDEYDYDNTRGFRDELLMTLRAAQQNLAPPVYAAFPMKVISQQEATTVGRSYGYIFEDGWIPLRLLLDDLPNVHTDPSTLRMAQEFIEIKVGNHISDVSKAGFLMGDNKMWNMVARRVPSKDGMGYEVRVIDFGADYASEPNRNSPTRQTPFTCIFFINTLLFLNELAAWHRKHVATFSLLASQMESRWNDMQHTEGSLCEQLGRDMQAATERYTQKSLMRISSEQRFHATLRRMFYFMLKNYADAALMKKTIEAYETTNPVGFITRFVKLLSEEYAQARKKRGIPLWTYSKAVETDDEGS